MKPPALTFFDFPAELRNAIYNYALVQDNPTVLPYAFEKVPFHEPALLSTHSWIRAEATSIFFGGNVFEAPSPAAARHFLKQLDPEHIAMLRMFRPIELVLSLSAHKRWFDALRANINRLVAEAGQGVLDVEVISVPIRGQNGEVNWCKLRDIERLEIVYEEHGLWSLGWREAQASDPEKWTTYEDVTGG